MMRKNNCCIEQEILPEMEVGSLWQKTKTLNIKNPGGMNI